MRAEWLDTAALRTSRRYAALTALGILTAVMLPFLQLRAPKLHLPVVRQLVMDMREVAPPQTAPPLEEERRLLAGESPWTVLERPRPPEVVRPAPEAPPKAVTPPTPASVTKPRPQKRPAPTPRAAPPVSAGTPAPAAPAAARAEISATARQSALALLVREIERRKHYPKQARRTGAQGTVTLAIRIGADGRVKECSIAKNCGIGVLDLETGRLGAKLVGFSTGAGGAEFTVQVPVRYSLQ